MIKKTATWRKKSTEYPREESVIADPVEDPITEDPKESPINEKPKQGPITVKPTEAVVQRCSVKNGFLEISQNSQKNTCARVFFFK